MVTAGCLLANPDPVATVIPMKLIRTTTRTLLSLLALWSAPAPIAQPSQPQPPPRHTFWKVEGKTNVLYLLGSVHVLKPGDYPLPAIMDDAFTNCPVLVFETDMAAMEDPAVQLKILGKAQLPPGETLSQHLSDPVYRAFTNHVTSAGLPPTMFDQFKPALAAITLAVLEIQKLGFSPEYGVDKHYFERARDDKGKQIVPLETVDFQVGLVTDFTKEEGELLLKTTMEEVDNTKKEFRELLKAWQTGDVVTLERLLNEASRQAPVIYKRLLTDRNDRWVPKLEELLRGDKRVMAIVGAGHLVGPDGVVELLKKRGWKITQL
jgi:uncharacterized protein